MASSRCWGHPSWSCGGIPTGVITTSRLRCPWRIACQEGRALSRSLLPTSDGCPSRTYWALSGRGPSVLSPPLDKKEGRSEPNELCSMERLTPRTSKDLSLSVNEEKTCLSLRGWSTGNRWWGDAELVESPRSWGRGMWYEGRTRLFFVNNKRNFIHVSHFCFCMRLFPFCKFLVFYVLYVLLFYLMSKVWGHDGLWYRIYIIFLSYFSYVSLIFRLCENVLLRKVMRSYLYVNLVILWVYLLNVFSEFLE